VRLLIRPAHAAAEIFARACYEGTELSLAIGVEQLVLACAILSPALEEYGVTPEDIRERIRADERDALASLGISLESVRGELEERFGGEVWSHAHCVGVSPEAKRMLELATRRRRKGDTGADARNAHPAQRQRATAAVRARRAGRHARRTPHTLKRTFRTSPSSTT
jgi:hypothetical protein